MFAQVTDHASRALGRMLTQFKSSAQFKGILNTLSSEIQALEDAIVGMSAVRDIDNATGVTLDKLARFVGAPDRSYTLDNSDAAMRGLIRTQIVVNKSTGIDADYYALIALMHCTDDVKFFKVRHGSPASWALGDVGDPTGEYTHTAVIEIIALSDDSTGIAIDNVITADDAAYFARLFKAIAPEGTRAILKYRSQACDVAFRFSGGSHTDRAGFGVGKLFNSKDK